MEKTYKRNASKAKNFKRKIIVRSRNVKEKGLTIDEIQSSTIHHHKWIPDRWCIRHHGGRTSFPCKNKRRGRGNEEEREAIGLRRCISLEIQGNLLERCGQTIRDP